MNLQDLTWPDVEAYLKQKDSIIVPIGSIEQHGPSGVMGTDAMVAEAIAKDVGALTQVLVGPVVSIGIAEHHMAFPGTLSLRPSTLIALISDYINSLAHHGFRRFFFINGHGGNTSTLKAAFTEIHTQERLDARNRLIQCTVTNWYDVDDVVVLRKRYYGELEGRHATPSEIAVVQHLRSDLIHKRELPQPTPYQGEVYGAVDFRGKYPDGRVAAHSSMATPEQGCALYDLSVTGVAKLATRFFADE